MQPNFIRTNIEGFDETAGGIPPGSTILLLGPPGAGTEVFAQEVCYKYARLGGKVAYFTIERPPIEVSDDMRAHLWNVEPLEAAGNWIFIDAYTSRLRGHFIKMGGKPEATIMPSLQEMGALGILQKEVVSKLQAKMWTVVDSLSYLLLMHDLKDVVSVIETYRQGVRENAGLHFFLLVEGMHPPHIVTTMKHLSDGVISFVMKEKAGGLEGHIEVSKMRRSTAGLKTVPYAVSQKGILIETAKRIA
jgi:KaiC/GvpD/RAD55 family RecA-like ATPase